MRDTILVKHTFTPEERVELSEQMVEAENTVNEAKEDLEQVKKQFAATIRTAETQRKLAASKLRAGFEMQEVACKVEIDDKTKTAKLYREDNGDFVLERPAKDTELQRALPI